MKSKTILLILLTLRYASIALLNAQTTNEISVDKKGTIFTFSFNCEGGPCEYGQFATGDYWIATKTPTGTVTITGMTPDGEINGAMLNPDLLRDSSGELISFENQKQGILSTYPQHYDANLNVMNIVPFTTYGDVSIIKIEARTSDCGTKGIAAGCVNTSAILTILKEVPENRGATLFRPPFHGTWKPLFSVDKVKMNRLPKLPQASDGTNGVIGGTKGFETWLEPQIEIYHSNRGGMGEFHRAMIPHGYFPRYNRYASAQARIFLEDLTKVFGKEPEEEKKAAVYSLVQKGIDIYAVYKMGIPFQSGAGQHLGKKPPLVFFASMYDDVTILEDVRSIASNQEAIEKRFFQEDAQITMGKSGMPIWGDHLGIDNIHLYFNRLYPKLDGQGSAADPYGYIDGPAGGIYPDTDNTNRDRNYINVAGGPIIGYAFLQHLMPWFKYAAGDDEVLIWSDRIYKGYGIDNFDGGLWTLPDPVAPRDPNESGDCRPDKVYSTGITNCKNYMSTWGPKENNLGEFIGHGKDPNTHGRMPELHGKKIDFVNLTRFTSRNWDELRPCSDPRNASYPCEGLGELPTTVLSIDEVSTGDDPLLSIDFSKDFFKVNTVKEYKKITIDLFSILGKELAVGKGSGNTITLKISDKAFKDNTLYIYRVSLDGEIYSGKFLIK